FAKGCAVYWRIAFTSGGVRPGFACNMSAAAPATTGAATDVPLNSISVWFGAWVAPGTIASCGYVVTSWFHPARVPRMSEESAPTTRLPGATRSGLSQPSTVGPRELKPATVSSARAVVECMLIAPTVITVGSWPGDPTAPYISRPSAVLPALPAATTTTMPAADAARAARANGSVTYDSVEPAARLRVITRMFSSLALRTTQSMPASTS